LAWGTKKASSPDSAGLTIPATAPFGPVRVKLDAVSVVTLIGSENRIATMVLKKTFWAALPGLTERTVGAAVSAAGGP